MPGQRRGPARVTRPFALNFGTGTFFFQCDPHAALGMTGHVTIK